MTIYASCGHQLQAEEGPNGVGHAVCVRSWSREEQRSVDYMNVCSECLSKMEGLGVLLKTDSAQDQWLSGEGSNDQPVW